MDRDADEFITLLTAAQTPLYGCILSILPDRAAARDILQETNLTLWHKAEDFEHGTNFLAWASRIARYHVLNHRRKISRERLVFDDALFEELCDRQASRIEDFDRKTELLHQCLGKLPASQRGLVERRYAAGGSVQRIAREDGRSVGSISQSLYRIRETLLNCVHSTLASESST